MSVQTVPVVCQVSNMTVANTTCFDATETIVLAGSATYCMVQPTGHATLIAGMNILCLPGTTVQEGGYLWGYIAPAGPFCSAPAKETAITAAEGVAVRQGGEVSCSLFPNPTHGPFTVRFDGSGFDGIFKAEIYNMQGARITSRNLEGHGAHAFSLAGQPAGIYLIRIWNGDRSGSFRVVLH